MTAPELHGDEFTTRENAPPMSAIERGHTLKVSYTPTGSDHSRVARGTITYAGYGKFKDVIRFKPHHTDTEWKLECYKTGMGLYYDHGSHFDDYRRLDTPHKPTTAQLEQ